MRNRILLLGLALAPSLAAAQVTVTETSTGSTGFINIAECENSTPDGLTFTWTFPGTLVAGGTYTLTASTKDQCPTDVNQGAKNVTVAANIAATSLSGSHPTSGSVGVQSLLQQLGLQCTGPATAVFFCVTLSGSALTTQATGSMTLDLGKPPPPVAQRADPGDSSLTVSWSVGSGANTDAGTSGSVDSWQITAVNTAPPNDQHTSDRLSGGTGTTSGRITGLENGVTYDVTVQAFSPGGNASDPSAKIQGKPVPVNDFFRTYRNEGGRETGGCAAGAAGMLALLAVPLALRAWRRRS